MFFVRWIGNIAQSYQRAFTILMVGQIIFFVGLALFYLSAEKHQGTPLLAEFMVLLSIIVMTAGFITAIIGYLSLTYGRWYHFFRKPKKAASAKALVDEDNMDIEQFKNSHQAEHSVNTEADIAEKAQTAVETPAQEKPQI